MKKLALVYSKESAKIIRHLSPLVKKGIRLAIQEIFENPYIGKSLRDDLQGLRSHKFRRHRVVYRYQEKKGVVEIVFVGRRDTVYDLLSQILKQ